MAFSYIGVEPTNDKSSNNGVFDITALNKLRKDENLSSEGFDVDFFIVAGGGSSVRSLGTGGGGGGMVVTSLGNNGGQSTAEPSFRAYVGKEYDVEVGAGSANRGDHGGNSQFATIVALGGGSGASQNSDAYPAGGAARFSGTGNRDAIYATTFDNTSDNYFQMFGHNTKGNQIGSSGSYNEGHAGGGGAWNGGSQSGGGQGVNNTSFLSSTEATTESIGEVSSTNVYYAGGGAGGNYGGSATSGGLGGGGNPAQAGTARTGGGSGGSPNNNDPGAGGSGVILLRYPDTYTLSQTGLTLGNNYTAGGFTVTPIKAGDGTVSWSKA